MNLSIPLQELVAHARAHCPFYRRLYADLPVDPALTDLPVVDNTAFWAAHHQDRREVLTGPQVGGVIIGSGGTTGAPKFVYYNDADVDRGLEATVVGMDALGLHDGDRVANLFSAGELYGSFLGFTSSLKLMRAARPVHVPIGQRTPIPSAVRHFRRFQVNVIAGLPTQFLQIASYLDREDIRDVPLEMLIYAGESFFPGQRKIIQAILPEIKIKSLAYASVDAGMIGFADDSCVMDEHRTIATAGVMEIMDENTGAPILETGRPGRIVYTNLTRELMPAIRYPTGDLAMWVEPPSPDALGVTRDQCKFTLLGRADEAARIAFVNLYAADVRTQLEPFRVKPGWSHLQMLIEQVDARDRLTLRMVGRSPRVELEKAAPEMLDVILQDKPALAGIIQAGIIHPLQIAWIDESDLLINERTGKLRTVVDRRRPDFA